VLYNARMVQPDDVKEWRKATRTELLAQRQTVLPEQRLAWNATITASLSQAFPELGGLIVSFYWPFKGEFDPRFFVRDIRQRGARAALPVVVRKAAPLEFREWWPGVPMKKGVFDLPVPDGTLVVTPQAMLIPPVGFDAQGYRLGYGGGYFDRTLAALPDKPFKIGVAFELSRMSTIHPQPHDIAMDFVVTEAGVHAVDNGHLKRLWRTPVIGTHCARSPT
jgi:5-formyltetrahydrofolate cyclo-ligase